MMSLWLLRAAARGVALLVGPAVAAACWPSPAVQLGLALGVALFLAASATGRR